jgi:cytochrome c peroxidase
VSCHHPVLGGGDNLSLPVGVNAENPDLLGPGRNHDAGRAFADANSHYDGGPTVPRNAPSTFNIALWDQVLFHDGRVESLDKLPGTNGAGGSGIRTPDSALNVADPSAGPNLTAAQARFPVTSPEEMRGFTFQQSASNASVRAALENKLNGFINWQNEFQFVYGDSTITYDRIGEAIGEFERSQVFVDSPWKAYVEGDLSAISDAAKRGALFFFRSIDQGGANCASCHAGDFFSDEAFHVTAMPQVGRGKGDGTFADDDFGRARETGLDSDRYRFRTPTLLNTEVTGPWGHAGAYTSLRAAVIHMLNPGEAIANYDFSQLNSGVQATNMTSNTQQALSQLEKHRAATLKVVLDDVVFNDDDVADLVEFLRTLTDPCVKDRSCLAPWIPDSQVGDPDGLRLNAVNSSNSLL